jgi:subtilisin family serine protease
MKYTLRTAILVMLMCAFFAALPPVAAHAGNYVPGEAIVVLKNKTGGLSAASIEASASSGHVAQVAASAGASATKTFSALSAASDSVFVLFKSEAKTTEQLVAELKANPDVIAVSPNYVVHALAVPTPSEYNASWGMVKINAWTAWNNPYNLSGRGKAVAVIDSGIYAAHTDLDANVDSRSRNFTDEPNVNDVNDVSDNNGHGTHVSGVIAAEGNNVGMAGVSFESKIITLKTMKSDGTGDVSYTIAAIDYLIGLTNAGTTDIKAANFSLGAYYEPVNAGDKLTGADLLGDPFYMAFKALDSLNAMVIVVAAGNENVEVGAPVPSDFYDDRGNLVKAGSICAPASFIGLNNMIVVGSTGSLDTKSGFSNWSGKYVQLAAPGENIYSTYITTTTTTPIYSQLSGTSMAAPHVAGAIALLASSSHSNHLNLNNTAQNATKLRSHLLRTANGNIGGSPLSAFGLLNVGAAATTTFAGQSITGIAVKAPRRIFPGDVFFAAAEITPDNASDRTITWSSSNAGVAAVNAPTGKVTAVAVGTATITATGGGFSGSADIVVSEAPSGDGGDSSMGCNAGALAAIPLAALAYALIKRKSRHN